MKVKKQSYLFYFLPIICFKQKSRSELEIAVRNLTYDYCS